MAAGCLVALLLTAQVTWLVIGTGVFLDPDDALRAVQVRDLLAGQGWFDLVPHRMSPDHPFVMHWSRLADLPLALPLWLFGRVLPPGGAELAMRLLVPSALFVVALRLVIDLARQLLGRNATLAAALLFAGSTQAVSQFTPGHIHHHGLQAVLLLAATCAAVRALRHPGRPRPAAAAGVLLAVSLGIGLQSLPFMLALASILGAAWIAWGRAAMGLLAGFGAGVAAGSLAVYGLDVPPGAYGSGACDAFSTAHLLVFGAGGLGAMVLAGATRAALDGPARRLGAAAALGLLLLLALRALYPACLGDPMAGVDPLLRREWLSGVGEALPLHRLVTGRPSLGVPLLLTLLCGFGATLGAAAREPPRQRPLWAALLLLCAVGMAGTCYQVRVAPSACALMVPGVAWLVRRVFTTAAARPRRPALLLAVLAGLFGNGAAWAALGVPLGRWVGEPATTARDASGNAATEDACFRPALYAPLAALPPGLVLSTIDPGPVILAATAHSVLAGPYHRNTAGNRVAILAWKAPPEAARLLVAGARVTYVVLCRASNEAEEIAALHPDSLAAALLADRAPAWLTPVGATAGAPLLVFRVAS